MPNDQRALPIFPLNTVLFPNSYMPLQIFEERYKTMLEDCESHDSKFGIVLIKSGVEVGEPATPFSIGTVARLVEVNRVAGGKIFISVQGEQRFEINEVTQNRPYMIADVNLLDDAEDSLESPIRAKEIQDQVNEYSRLAVGMRGGWVNSTRLPTDLTELTYHVADTLQVDMRTKQVLLEQARTSERLDTISEILSKLIPQMKKRVSEELRGRFSAQ